MIKVKPKSPRLDDDKEEFSDDELDTPGIDEDNMLIDGFQFSRNENEFSMAIENKELGFGVQTLEMIRNSFTLNFDTINMHLFIKEITVSYVVKT